MNKIKKFIKKNWMFFAAGIVIGLAAITLTCLGNPKNMGFCIACFLRDTAGGLGMLQSGPMYVRPEIIGIVLGAFVISLIFKEFSPTGGSAPVTRFILGACVMVGALMFLGCPVRMFLRIAGGDLNALIALPGLILGALGGMFFLSKGFTLKRSYKLATLEGYAAPAISILFLVLVSISAAGVTFFMVSATGPGSMQAPVWASLIAGLIVGVIGQRVRACFVGGIRDAFMFKHFHMVYLFLALVVTALIGNLITGDFKLSMSGQPVAHQEVLTNIAGLFLVGIGATLLGGCPMRQLVLAGSGSSDAAITVFGMIFGAVISHNFGLASSGDSTNATTGVVTLGGAGKNAWLGFAICLVIVLIIAVLNSKNIIERFKKKKDKKETPQTETSAAE